MNRIVLYFLIFVVSLILTFFNKITYIGGGFRLIAEFLENRFYILDSLLYKVIYLLELLGIILFIYSLFMFLFECYIFLKKRNKD